MTKKKKKKRVTKAGLISLDLVARKPSSSRYYLKWELITKSSQPYKILGAEYPRQGEQLMHLSSTEETGLTVLKD